MESARNQENQIRRRPSRGSVPVEPVLVHEEDEAENAHLHNQEIEEEEG